MKDEDEEQFLFPRVDDKTKEITYYMVRKHLDELTNAAGLP